MLVRAAQLESERGDVKDGRNPVGNNGSIGEIWILICCTYHELQVELISEVHAKGTL